MDEFTITFLLVGLSLAFVVSKGMRGSSIVARRIVGMLVAFITIVITGAIMGWFGW